MSDERRGAGSKIERPGQDVTVGRKLLRYAHRAAETGDRWFVAMAQGVWRAGSWARAEAETVSDAASAALQTTVTTTRSMMGDGSSKPAGPEGVDGRVARPPDRALEGSEQAPARCQDRHAPGPETAPGTQPSRRRLVGNPASAPRSRGASTRPRLELVQSAPAEEPDLGPETEEAASFAARGGG
ncbi:MAG: hypothetical protein OEY14_04285, partial [Myxococcales bacterium]|nr:hypothetical protein [Myxococcales bacterium]